MPKRSRSGQLFPPDHAAAQDDLPRAGRQPNDAPAVKRRVTEVLLHGEGAERRLVHEFAGSFETWRPANQW